jgi:hypothetical protein
MLSELDQKTTQFVETEVPKFRTDNLRPLAWMTFVFVLSLFGAIISIDSLNKMKPPADTYLKRFFLTTGKHYWVVKSSSDKYCSAAILGGWKKDPEHKGEKLGFRFKFKNNSSTFVKEPEITGQVFARSGEYRNIERFQARVNNKNYTFNGKSWEGISSAPKDPLLLIETLEERRQLRVPGEWGRNIERMLQEIIGEQNNLRQVTETEYKECLGLLRL